MQLNWQSVESTRIVAEAFDPGTETIYVRFPSGIEWYYEACPLDVWEAFTAPGQSRGQFIHQTLDYKPNNRHQ
ncbi:KTSC domain-containing protein [Rhodococcus sp. C3V]|uniref:KTSC domain-containing protein n=1 Tax=Rhodococcus sp. C3V TaxID=3034165 RepID=UPI0023E26CE5|nr:KTSC domain-containing protein [Rhodococcus sp. C3V]MDF3319901.1 KTSC domain-containing protein [Rhodococcus sp. C3V]